MVACLRSNRRPASKYFRLAQPIRFETSWEWAILTGTPARFAHQSTIPA
jgi:hypothetical protein